ncbi:MAG: hypothetical protein EA397_10465 [Deltaproteobacteria bacterium]|nr:MAG: hypothetical protein EA397_10465 [Deltaproteobacteria bacterium]
MSSDKDVLTQALESTGYSADSTGYGDLAAELDPDRVAQRCPISFAPFWEELRGVAVVWGYQGSPRGPAGLATSKHDRS